MSDFKVLTPYTNEWVKISDTPSPIDATQNDQESALASLKSEFTAILDSETLIILVGSGASLGITDSSGKRIAPSMGDLWKQVSKLPSFDRIKNELSPEPLESDNLEHILSDAQIRSSLNSSNAELKTFIAEAEDIILKKCSFINERSKLESHQLFLRKVARRSSRLQRTQIFTTNYDLALEVAAQQARFNIIDGFGFGGHVFDGTSFDLDYIRRHPNGSPTFEPNVFHLLKLHGSVNWTISNNEVRKICDTDIPPSPVLIYPSASKYQLSYRQPYLEFMSRFQMALRQPNTGLIVVGFGFNDDHLTAPIESAIRSNVGLRAAFISPGADSPDRSQTYARVENLIRAGDRRLSLLTGTFDDLVRVLPAIPSFEDNDAHFERMSSWEGRS